jgi:NTP pyrophosphatase (non-canonical NTP hydrolase)
MSDLKDLQQRIISFRDARDWKQFHNPKDTAISLTLEASELLEHFQWKNAPEIEAYVKEHKTEIADELVDVLYWVLLIAHDLEIDVAKASEAKMAQNEAKYPVEKSKGKHTKYTEL